VFSFTPKVAVMIFVEVTAQYGDKRRVELDGRVKAGTESLRS
jgi:hypothetical protein